MIANVLLHSLTGTSLMLDANAILGNKAFWFFYVRQSDSPLEGDVLNHFDTITIQGEEYPDAVISLPCAPNRSLDVNITPYFFTVNLGLRNTKTNTMREMGWWDDARWHPFALRWSELLAVHEYWINRPGFDIHPSAAFLLLAIFVGNGVDERDDFGDRKNVIRDHYNQLQLFTDSEIETLTEKTLVLPTEDDYNWTQDDEFGWLFGGEYPCYSIRNREHSDGSEGLFPFAEWSAVVDQL